MLIKILSQQQKSDEEALGKDLGILEYWRELSQDERFHAVLSYALNDLGRYAPENTGSEHPHLQAELVGGYKGIMFFVQRLLTSHTNAIIPRSSKSNDY